MRMSDSIAEFIMDTLAGAGGAVEIQRNELADRFNCVPSQINYVISTRFSPEHGYTVESRRGGGGYIRITRLVSDRPSMIMHTVNAVGETLDMPSAYAILRNLIASDTVSPLSARILLTVISDNALSTVAPEDRGKLRARIFKLGLLAMNERE